MVADKDEELRKMEGRPALARDKKQRGERLSGGPIGPEADWVFEALFFMNGSQNRQ